MTLFPCVYTTTRKIAIVFGYNLSSSSSVDICFLCDNLSTSLVFLIKSVIKGNKIQVEIKRLTSMYEDITWKTDARIKEHAITKKHVQKEKKKTSNFDSTINWEHGPDTAKVKRPYILETRS